MVEKIKEVIEKHKNYIPVKVIAELLTIIENEEYCEWKWRIEDGKKVFKNCLYIADTHIAYSFKYCPYCGKPRKERMEDK